ncbi:BTAD domain-containing putative transcriptional regulator [Streptomyces sp. NBC_00576]|uniref:BTAD domain-containing putative transcriptional regulator n=1 Tax=Streptomyces sp. NBC_00576 TaxID=2903665 RepID=UPI002E802140|nr:BTAD domain-containing putative transcriptional regulator [Streptomyces sp. NBC_00576]WUB74084.1 AAA family ATPase [Streptomyces sp. NBC_00576]
MNRLVAFGLLGSVEARVQGRFLDLGHARQRCVLAVLLVEAGRSVPVDELVNRVWADSSPRHARDTLYGYVSRLRRALADVDGADIVRRSGGYVLDVERAAVDLHRFHDLVAGARAAGQDDRAAAVFDQALGLWRGDALAGLDTPWTNALRTTLDQERLEAELERTDIRLRRGRHTELLADLARRAQAHPLDERLAGQFLLALYRCGRPADALHSYERLRQRLADELGCDPSPPLRLLHQRMLTTDPALDLPAADPVPVSAAVAVRRRTTVGRLVGRTTELALAERAIEDAVAGTPGVLELVGEPGIGKTRLLVEVGEQGRRRGLTVLTGRCGEWDQAPYGVFVDALDDHLGALDASSGLPLGLLGAVFPALSAWCPDGPKPVTAERHWFHRSVRALLETLGGAEGILLGLDDLHGADAATVELIDHLARHPPRTPLLLVLAHRPRQAPPRLIASLSRSKAEGRSARIEIQPLSRAECAELCGAATGKEQFDRLYEESEGNPFYLEALARSTGTPPPPAPTDPGPTPDGLPPSVRAALQQELEGLSATARATAGAAAVLGDTFDVDTAAAVARIADTRALEALDELADRDLVRQLEVTRRFQFRHPLVRAAVYQGLGAGWRIEAHGRAADSLASRGASLITRAPHVQRSAREGDTEAADLLVRAARQVLTLAPVTSASWTGEALRLLGGHHPARPELLLQQADALGLAGRLQDSRDLLREAAALLPVDAHGLQARTIASLARAEWQLGRYQQARDLLLRELANGNGRPASDIVILHLGIAAVALRTSDLPASVDWAKRALRTAERHQDAPRIAEAHGLLALAHVMSGNHARSTEHLDLAHDALDDTGDQQVADHLNTLVTVCWTQMFQGRYESALHGIAQGLKVCRHTGQSVFRADLLETAAYVHLWLGRLDDAAAYAAEALEAATLVGSDESRSLATVVNAAVLMWRGDGAGALKICQESLSRAATDPDSHRSAVIALLGQAMLLTGDPAGCVRTVVEGGGGPGLTGYEAPMRPLWLRTLAVAELARGDVPAAERWVHAAAEAVPPDGPPSCTGFALLARAEVQLFRRDAAAASTALRAADVFRAARMPLYEASARLTAGSALSSSDRPTDAPAQLVQARTLFTQCGADVLAESAHQAHQAHHEHSRVAVADMT